ncbi:MAG TPA: hypothetical protein VFG59_04255 [Anaeromyxobacter sp.]|nr:hypothetical protein [Anaeromyxobacter sp.]
MLGHFHLIDRRPPAEEEVCKEERDAVMAVAGVGSALDVNAVSLGTVTPQVQSSGTLPDATQSSISPEGNLFAELDSLSKQDPTRFKEVAQKVADQLKEEASNSTGKRAQFLTSLADRFGQAAQTGDASSLQPPEAGAKAHHGGHHHKHGGSQTSGAGSQPGSSGSLADIIQQALQDTDTTSSTPSA